MARQSIRYLLLDLPSDHEIEGALATECDVLFAMLTNLELAGVTKRVRIAQSKTLKTLKQHPYDAEVVHVAGHATKDGLWMLGEVLPWGEVAKHLAACVTPLRSTDSRILNLSCCHSHKAATRMHNSLLSTFTGIHHFVEDKIPYAKAIAAWTMFFCKQPTTANHADIVQSISAFFGGEVLRYVAYLPRDEEAVRQIEAMLRRPDSWAFTNDPHLPKSRNSSAPGQ